MKTLKDYIAESETWMQTPAEGDTFGIELSDGTLIESYILELADDSILLDATADIVSVLESWNLLSDQESEDGVILEGQEELDEVAMDMPPSNPQLQMNPPSIQAPAPASAMQKPSLAVPAKAQDRDLGNGFTQTTINFAGRMLPAVLDTDSNTYILLNKDPNGSNAIARTPAKYIIVKGGKSQPTNELGPDTMSALEKAGLLQDFKEAKYHGREVPLGKPMAGDVKKSKVYVRDPATGNIKKVNFGDPNMRIKKTSPARRKSFRARHNCANPGPRTKARYWSCRAW
jgi:hypothetical protein